MIRLSLIGVRVGQDTVQRDGAEARIGKQAILARGFQHARETRIDARQDAEQNERDHDR